MIKLSLCESMFWNWTFLWVQSCGWCFLVTMDSIVMGSTKTNVLWGQETTITPRYSGYLVIPQPNHSNNCLNYVNSHSHAMPTPQNHHVSWWNPTKIPSKSHPSAWWIFHPFAQAPRAVRSDRSTSREPGSRRALEMDQDHLVGGFNSSEKY